MNKFAKYVLLMAGFALLVTFVHIPGTMTKVHANGGTCSLATLRGTYSYLRSGTNTALGGPTAEMGIEVFNGEGLRGIIRNTGVSLSGSFDWSDSTFPTGSYTLAADCTGTLFNAAGTEVNNIIVLDGGKKYMVLSAPNETTKVITGEATKLDDKE